jgi:threonylcarbamoyladenosine tRNA methylthiotransferase MtaB
MVEDLGKRGFTIVPFDSEADIYIINTCTVTERTDYQSRQLVRRAHRKNPSATIIATGCYAQTAPEKLASLPGIGMVVGTAEKRDIPLMLKDITEGEPDIIVGDITCTEKLLPAPLSQFPGHTRAFLKIQDGCNAFCSYCIIPYARGRSRSFPEDAVISQIKKFSASGYREVVLTGIHLGMYGHDLVPQTSLITLLRKIEECGSIDRLRISSIEPMEITDEIIAHIEDSNIMCRHLHIPLQSGDDTILASMKRNYTARRFRDVIDKIYRAVPEIAIGMDVMTGFPGEGEKEFTNTRNFLNGIPCAYLHVFPYSRRPGTVAATVPGQIQETIKKERTQELRILGTEKRIAYNSRFIGEKLSVLVENRTDRVTGLFTGFSDNYIPVLVKDGNESMVNRIVDIVSYGARKEKLLGRNTLHA